MCADVYSSAACGYYLCVLFEYHLFRPVFAPFPAATGRPLQSRPALCSVQSCVVVWCENMRAVGAMSVDLVYLLCVVGLTILLGTDNVSGGEGVRIKEIRVPDVVLNGTDKPVVLDCDYVLDTPARSSGLVVKWFFNNHPAPVYQWIFTQKPQDLGVLKGKVNLNHKATEDNSTMYRAIEIITPTTDLSGEYKCLVSTFDKEDSKSKKMIIYVPEKSLEMSQEKPSENSVIINCEAEGVYPEPNMTIIALESKHNGFIQVTTKKQNNSSLFDIKGSLALKDAELETPTTFMCELSIPDANYSNRRKLVYFPGPPTTPSAIDETPEPLPTSGASGSTISSSLLSVLALSVIVLVSSTGL